MFCPSILQNNRCGKVGCKLVNILCNFQLHLFLARKVIILITYFTLSSTISLEKWTTKTTFERRMYCGNGVIRTLFVSTWYGMVGIYSNFQHCPHISYFDNECLRRISHSLLTCVGLWWCYDNRGRLIWK